MASMYSIFNQEELDILRNLPEVQKTQGTSCTNFQASVPETIKQKLQSNLGLDLSQVSSVPFRWIHGDTKPHVDRGQKSFENTYLVYLTDGDGQFEVGDESYPITAGTGFVFPEGTHHAVTQSNGSSRLLLGPMSEEGFSVGGSGTSISADGSTTIVRISQQGGTITYEINGITNTLTFPVSIENTDPDPSGTVLQVFFTTDITLTHDYDTFSMNSDGIQIGSPNLKQDGSKYTINIDNVTGYPGLIASQNYSHLDVYNLHVAAINGSTLSSQYAGWIGQASYGAGGSNNYIINCSSDGPISTASGGIVGSRAGELGGNLTIIGCSSSGNIGSSGGGIAGDLCGSQGQVTINYCSSSGVIGSQGGGIVGEGAASFGSCNISNSYSTGTIGEDAGGIYGKASGFTSEGAAGSGGTAINCYSRGNIAVYGGGICGSYTASEAGTMILNNCYSSGTIGTSGNGLFGSNSRLEGCLADGTYFADGSWSDDDSASLIQSGYYRSVGVDEPYELKIFGPNPYSLTTITSNTVRIDFNTTIQAGSSLSPAISGFTTYSILQISSDGESDASTITINSTTGVISTTRSTPLDVYLIKVYAEKDNGQYTSTNVYITVLEPPPLGTGSIFKPGKGFNFETYNAIQLGNNLINHRVENKNLRFKSFEDYNKYLKSLASKR
jgi:hypothetical protein